MNVTTHPSAAWTLQQLREVIADADEHKYLIHDPDSIFARHLEACTRASATGAIRTACTGDTAWLPRGALVAAQHVQVRRIVPAHFSHINFRGTTRFGVEKFAAALIQRVPGQATRAAS